MIVISSRIKPFGLFQLQGNTHTSWHTHSALFSLHANFSSACNSGNGTILTACRVVTCILRRDSSSWRLDTCFSRDKFWTASCSLSDPSCSDRSFSCSACRCSSNLTHKKRHWRRLHNKEPHNLFPSPNVHETSMEWSTHGRHKKCTKNVNHRNQGRYKYK